MFWLIISPLTYLNCIALLLPSHFSDEQSFELQYLWYNTFRALWSFFHDHFLQNQSIIKELEKICVQFITEIRLIFLRATPETHPKDCFHPLEFFNLSMLITSFPSLKGRPLSSSSSLDHAPVSYTAFETPPLLGHRERSDELSISNYLYVSLIAEIVHELETVTTLLRTSFWSEISVKSRIRERLSQL